MNYVLRALYIPAGTHHINFKFEPEKVLAADRIAYAAILCIYAAIIGSAALALWRNRNKPANKE